MEDLDHPFQDFFILCHERFQLRALSGWILHATNPFSDQTKAWRRSTRTYLPLGIEELEEEVNKFREKMKQKKTSLGTVFRSLSRDQQQQIERLLQHLQNKEQNPQYQWKLAMLNVKRGNAFAFPLALKIDKILSIVVIIEKELRTDSIWTSGIQAGQPKNLFSLSPPAFAPPPLSPQPLDLHSAYSPQHRSFNPPFQPAPQRDYSRAFPARVPQPSICFEASIPLPESPVRSSHSQAGQSYSENPCPSERPLRRNKARRARSISPSPPDSNPNFLRRRDRQKSASNYKRRATINFDSLSLSDDSDSGEGVRQKPQHSDSYDEYSLIQPTRTSERFRPWQRSMSLSFRPPRPSLQSPSDQIFSNLRDIISKWTIIEPGTF